MLLGQLSGFQQSLIDEFWELQNATEKAKDAKRAMVDAELDENGEFKVTKENVDAIMNSNECYEHMQALARKKRDIKLIKRGAEDLLKALVEGQQEGKHKNAGKQDQIKQQYL